MKKQLKDFIYVIFIFIVMFFITSQPSFSLTLKFAQLSDIHHCIGREDTSYKLLSHTIELLDDAVNQINNEKDINFVIATGDIIDKPDKKALNEVIDDLNKLHYPWYITLGNHDTVLSSEIDKTTFFNIIREKNQHFDFDKPYYTFKPKRGFRVIVMDGASNTERKPCGEFSQDELNWLDEILSKSTKDVVLIFQHFPVVTPFQSKSHEIKNSDEYLAVLKKYDMPIAVFTGHYHATKIIKQNNILHVSTPALVSYPNSFRIVEVKNKSDKVIFKFKYNETNLKDLQETAKIRIVGDKLLYGKPNDRNTEITIEKK